ncbi:hypothetical protein ScPMuIL_009157 [Solemya velum]
MLSCAATPYFLMVTFLTRHFFPQGRYTVYNAKIKIEPQLDYTHSSPIQTTAKTIPVTCEPTEVPTTFIDSRDRKSSDGESVKSSDDDGTLTDGAGKTLNTTSHILPDGTTSPHGTPLHRSAVTQEGSKKVRDNYSPRQINAFEKMFFENTYPDSDAIENLSEDIGVPKNKVKVWFQNKRARWRRRVDNNSNNKQQKPTSIPKPTQIPSTSSYGYLSPHPVFTLMLPHAYSRCPFYRQEHLAPYIPPQFLVQSQNPFCTRLAPSSVTKSEKEMTEKTPISKNKGFSPQNPAFFFPPFYYPHPVVC